MRERQILIACERPVWSGGFIRFERFGRVAAQRGYAVSFLPFSAPRAKDRPIDFPLITPDDARGREWTAVMIPGAAFSDETIEAFATLKAPNFGLRIQHILNDQSRRALPLRVNQAMNPDMVIFNNRHWTPGSYSDFIARQFHHLEGGVAIPQLARREPRHDGRFNIGGLANKNPRPLIDAASLFPDVELHLFGRPKGLPDIAQPMIESGRLKLAGMLEQVELQAFYRQLDCVVHTEQFAGWANLGAEALANGVPLVCTPHGTLAFARDGDTALVMTTATAEAIGERIALLRNDAGLRDRLTSNGRRAIEPYSWENYSDSLLALIERGAAA